MARAVEHERRDPWGSSGALMDLRCPHCGLPALYSGIKGAKLINQVCPFCEGHLDEYLKDKLRTCVECKRLFPLDEFRRVNGQGLTKRCSHCRALWRQYQEAYFRRKVQKEIDKALNRGFPK
jgi:hypothetical protein